MLEHENKIVSYRNECRACGFLARSLAVMEGDPARVSLRIHRITMCATTGSRTLRTPVGDGPTGAVNHREQGTTAIHDAFSPRMREKYAAAAYFYNPNHILEEMYDF